jgi:site-specific DNA-methyltransferase (adenine-specific)/modification methylase
MIRRGEENGTVRLHPTQKPVALMQWCLEQARLAPGSLVLDPYMGSGPIAIACQRSGYQYIGIEIEERYCETAAKRLEQAAQYQAALPLEVGA